MAVRTLRFFLLAYITITAVMGQSFIATVGSPDAGHPLTINTTATVPPCSPAAVGVTVYTQPGFPQFTWGQHFLSPLIRIKLGQWIPASGSFPRSFVSGGAQVTVQESEVLSSAGILVITTHEIWGTDYTADATGTLTLDTGNWVASVVANFSGGCVITQNATATLPVTLTPNPTLQITTTSLPDGVLGQTYSSTIAASGGTLPYSWSIIAGALPKGVALDTTSGAISATNMPAGLYKFTVQVSDRTNARSSMALSISVPCRPAQGIPGFHSLAPGASVCYPGVSTTTLWTKQFSNDSKLEFTCGPEASLGAISLLHPAYQLWYTNPRGERNRVAMCLFSGGDNDGYYTSVDNANGQSCLVSTHFENIDGGSKDAPKDVNGFVFTTTDAPGQPHIDELVYDYDANAEKLSWKDLKFNYPPGKTSLDNNAEIITYVTNATPIPGLGHTEDPPIGSLTEGLFTGLMALLLNEPSVPMYKFASCDVNLDGVCDATDFSLFRAAMGACVGRANYQERADMDRDGCVTLKDYQTWYEAYQNGK